MDKIQLVVLGLSASPASANAYALILKEAEGDRKLPIIIGSYEAQAIALEMEGVTPPRPMTHDLLKSVIDAFGSYLSEVYINDLKEGTFYAKLIFEEDGLEIDSRPSDAIALAVRCGAPIYVSEEVMEEAGISSQEGEESPHQTTILEKQTPPQRSVSSEEKIERLQKQLEKAVQEEDYEKAAKLRDEIKRILETS